MKADVQDQIKRDIETLFNERPLDDVAPEAVGRLLPIRNFLRRIDGFDLGSLTVAGEEAHWHLIVHTGFIRKSYPLVIRMKKKERWRVVALDGLATVIDLFERDAQAFTERANLSLRDSLGRRVQVQLESAERTQNWLLKRKVLWTVQFRNGSPLTLISLEGTLILRDSGRDVLREPLPPGQWNLVAAGAKSFSFESALDYFDPKAWESFDASRFTVAFEAEAVHFEGEAPQRWIKHWDEWPRDASVSGAKH